jgi:hypothetical protein
MFASEALPIDCSAGMLLIEVRLKPLLLLALLLLFALLLVKPEAPVLLPEVLLIPPKGSLPNDALLLLDSAPAVAPARPAVAAIVATAMPLTGTPATAAMGPAAAAAAAAAAAPDRKLNALLLVLLLPMLVKLALFCLIIFGSPALLILLLLLLLLPLLSGLLLPADTLAAAGQGRTVTGLLNWLTVSAALMLRRFKLLQLAVTAAASCSFVSNGCCMSRLAKPCISSALGSCGGS